MPVSISADDPRSIKAAEIAAGAAQWLRCYLKAGGKAFGVPSERRAGVYYLTTREACSCPAFTRWNTGEPCKHILAVRLHCELVKAQRMRSASTKRVRRVSKSKVTDAPTAAVDPRIARYKRIFGRED